MNLALAILKALDNVAPQALPRERVIDTLRISGYRETLTEITRTLQQLESGGEILSISNPDADGGYRDFITDQGKARLAQAGL